MPDDDDFGLIVATTPPGYRSQTGLRDGRPRPLSGGVRVAGLCFRRPVFIAQAVNECQTVAGELRFRNRHDEIVRPNDVTAQMVRDEPDHHRVGPGCQTGRTSRPTCPPRCGDPAWR